MTSGNLVKVTQPDSAFEASCPGESTPSTQTMWYLFDIDVLFRTRLKEVDSHLLGELLRISRLNHLGVGVVVLVSHCKQEVEPQ